MSGTGVKSSPEMPGSEILTPALFQERETENGRERQALLLRLFWERRHLLLRAAGIGLLASTLCVFLIPPSYVSTAQLMPPDSQSNSSLAMMAAMATKPGSGLAGMASDLLGLKSSSALFIGVLRSETSQDHIIQQFDLKKVYGMRVLSDARRKLDANTAISEDRKSGIISIGVTDHSPQRAAAIANAYVDELNSLVAQLSTSSAHRERVFLEERLKVAKVDLDDASNQLAQFSSKNNTLDMQTEGKAMLDAASTLAGQLIAAESELQGLRQIYTDNNARVRALNARVGELRKQLERLGGAQEIPHTNNQAVNASSAQATDQDSDKVGAPFPTIKDLPLLGAKYTDYYRRTKIQETVFELLTEQYELARVQEARETPSVKVLDPARVPDRKSFPPRLLFVLAGTFSFVAVTAIALLTVRTWTETDPADPRKLLALEVASSVHEHVSLRPQNGDSPEGWSRRIWSLLRGQRPPSDGPLVS